MVSITPKFESYAEAAAFLRKNPPQSREAVVVLSRHGETRFNVNHWLQGWQLDIDKLTPHGERQAARLAGALSCLHIQWAGSSDLNRAIHTLGIALPARETARLDCLREFNFGKLHGFSWDGDQSDFARYHPTEYAVFLTRRTKFDLTALEGESYARFQERVITGFEQAVLRPSIGGIGLALSHVFPIREIVVNRVLGTTVEEVKPAIDGTSITMVRFGADGSPDLLLFNNTQHLEADRLELRFEKWEPHWEGTRPRVIRKVLIVNDQPYAVKKLGDLFLSRCPTIEVVYFSGSIWDNFLDKVLSGNFDLVLMDCDLGTGDDGIRLARELRAKGFQGFIVASASGEKDNRSIIREGADFAVGRDAARLAEYF